MSERAWRRAAVVCAALACVPTGVRAQHAGREPEAAIDPTDVLSEGQIQRLLTATTLRMPAGDGVRGLVALVAGDGLVVTSAHVAGDVGSGCRTPITDRDAHATAWPAELLTVEVVGDTAVFRVRDFAGTRVGLRVANDGPLVGQRVYALADAEAQGLVFGRVEAHARGELRIELSGPVAEGAWGGPVVNADGHMLGVLSPMPGNPTHAIVSPLTVLRRVLPSLHRENSTPLCVPPYGASLGPTWHLGFELAAAIPTRGDAHSVYPIRATAMFFERWYFRMTLGASIASDFTALSGSLAGGPILFRTIGDGIVAIGARAEGDFGPFSGDFLVRREFYGLEVHAVGYLAPALGLTVNLAAGADRRWQLGQTTADYGAAIVFSAGLTIRTRHN